MVSVASAVEEVDASSDAFAALDELQRLLGLDRKTADAWVRRIRAERTAGGP
jgi:hypothetical protein